MEGAYLDPGEHMIGLDLGDFNYKEHNMVQYNAFNNVLQAVIGQMEQQDGDNPNIEEWAGLIDRGRMARHNLCHVVACVSLGVDFQEERPFRDFLTAEEQAGLTEEGVEMTFGDPGHQRRPMNLTPDIVVADRTNQGVTFKIYDVTVSYREAAVGEKISKYESTIGAALRFLDAGRGLIQGEFYGMRVEPEPAEIDGLTIGPEAVSPALRVDTRQALIAYIAAERALTAHLNQQQYHAMMSYISRDYWVAEDPKFPVFDEWPDCTDREYTDYSEYIMVQFLEHPPESPLTVQTHEGIERAFKEIEETAQKSFMECEPRSPFYISWTKPETSYVDESLSYPPDCLNAYMVGKFMGDLKTAGTIGPLLSELCTSAPKTRYEYAVFTTGEYDITVQGDDEGSNFERLRVKRKIPYRNCLGLRVSNDGIREDMNKGGFKVSGKPIPKKETDETHIKESVPFWTAEGLTRCQTLYDEAAAVLKAPFEPGIPLNEQYSPMLNKQELLLEQKAAQGLRDEMLQMNMSGAAHYTMHVTRVAKSLMAVEKKARKHWYVFSAGNPDFCCIVGPGMPIDTSGSTIGFKTIVRQRRSGNSPKILATQEAVHMTEEFVYFESKWMRLDILRIDGLLNSFYKFTCGMVGMIDVIKTHEPGKDWKECLPFLTLISVSEHVLDLNLTDLLSYLVPSAVSAFSGLGKLLKKKLGKNLKTWFQGWMYKRMKERTAALNEAARTTKFSPGQFSETGELDAESLISKWDVPSIMFDLTYSSIHSLISELSLNSISEKGLHQGKSVMFQIHSTIAEYEIMVEDLAGVDETDLSEPVEVEIKQRITVSDMKKKAITQSNEYVTQKRAEMHEILKRNPDAQLDKKLFRKTKAGKWEVIKTKKLVDFRRELRKEDQTTKVKKIRKLRDEDRITEKVRQITYGEDDFKRYFEMCLGNDQNTKFRYSPDMVYQMGVEISRSLSGEALARMAKDLQKIDCTRSALNKTSTKGSMAHKCGITPPTRCKKQDALLLAHSDLQIDTQEQHILHFIDCEAMVCVVPKRQSTAVDREIYILDVVSIMALNLVESVAKAICDQIDIEMITVSGDIKEIKMQMDFSKLVQDIQRLSEKLGINLMYGNATWDESKWSVLQCFAMYIHLFKGLEHMLPKNLAKTCAVILQRMQEHLYLYLPDEFLAEAQKGEEKQDWSGSPLYRWTEGYRKNKVKMNCNWMQGQMNFCSSLLHSAQKLFSLKVYRRVAFAIINKWDRMGLTPVFPGFEDKAKNAAKSIMETKGYAKLKEFNYDIIVDDLYKDVADLLTGLIEDDPEKMKVMAVVRRYIVQKGIVVMYAHSDDSAIAMATFDGAEIILMSSITNVLGQLFAFQTSAEKSYMSNCLFEFVKHYFSGSDSVKPTVKACCAVAARPALYSYRNDLIEVMGRISQACAWGLSDSGAYWLRCLANKRVGEFYSLQKGMRNYNPIRECMPPEFYGPYLMPIQKMRYLSPIMEDQWKGECFKELPVDEQTPKMLETMANVLIASNGKAFGNYLSTGIEDAMGSTITRAKPVRTLTYFKLTGEQERIFDRLKLPQEEFDHLMEIFPQARFLQPRNNDDLRYLTIRAMYNRPMFIESYNNLSSSALMARALKQVKGKCMAMMPQGPLQFLRKWDPKTATLHDFVFQETKFQASQCFEVEDDLDEEEDLELVEVEDFDEDEMLSYEELFLADGEDEVNTGEIALTMKELWVVLEYLQHKFDFSSITPNDMTRVLGTTDPGVVQQKEFTNSIQGAVLVDKTPISLAAVRTPHRKYQLDFANSAYDLVNMTFYTEEQRLDPITPRREDLIQSEAARLERIYPFNEENRDRVAQEAYARLAASRKTKAVLHAPRLHSNGWEEIQRAIVEHMLVPGKKCVFAASRAVKQVSLQTDELPPALENINKCLCDLIRYCVSVKMSQEKMASVIESLETSIPGMEGWEEIQARLRSLVKDATENQKRRMMFWALWSDNKSLIGELETNLNVTRTEFLLPQRWDKVRKKWVGNLEVNYYHERSVRRGWDGIHLSRIGNSNPEARTNISLWRNLRTALNTMGKDLLYPDGWWQEAMSTWRLFRGERETTGMYIVQSWRSTGRGLKQKYYRIGSPQVNERYCISIIIDPNLILRRKVMRPVDVTYRVDEESLYRTLKKTATEEKVLTVTERTGEWSMLSIKGSHTAGYADIGEASRLIGMDTMMARAPKVPLPKDFVKIFKPSPKYAEYTHLADKLSTEYKKLQHGEAKTERQEEEKVTPESLFYYAGEVTFMKESQGYVKQELEAGGLNSCELSYLYCQGVSLPKNIQLFAATWFIYLSKTPVITEASSVKVTASDKRKKSKRRKELVAQKLKSEWTNKNMQERENLRLWLKFLSTVKISLDPRFLGREIHGVVVKGVFDPEKVKLTINGIKMRAWAVEEYQKDEYVPKGVRAFHNLVHGKKTEEDDWAVFDEMPEEEEEDVVEEPITTEIPAGAEGGVGSSSEDEEEMQVPAEILAMMQKGQGIFNFKG
uniref:RNA-dependent RNA polymerase n=1 Tax=Beihai bunya-like virus 5 TaxID=1922375 RepID=A0A1L3KPC1_9VIRU|nr:RNA-dependent RNA polymerase [Beihai bunya-like virus 5]